ncbi:MAG: TIM barrel protein [bacterium]|nr:TIM barrel protein [bacterium]
MQRRSFLAAGAAAGAGIMTANRPVRAAEKGKGVLKFSCQEWVLPGKTLEEKMKYMKEWGIVGFEPGGGGLAGRVKELKDAFKGTDIVVSAICAGFKGVPISDDPDVRKQCKASFKEILGAAGELGSTGLIMVPAFNGQTKLGFVEGRKILVEDFLPEVGEYAQQAGTRVLLEPLNRGEAWFMRQLADAAAICRDVNHPGVCMMGDFYHMGIEEPDEYAAFLTARKWLHHVHLASRPNRKQPGYDPNDDFRDGFRALKEIGYSDFCSFECGIEGKPEVEIPKAMDYLRKQWNEA